MAVATDDDARPRGPRRTPRRRPRARRRRPRSPRRRRRRRAGPGIGSQGDPDVTQGDAGPFVPASTTKLLTTTAALAALGPDHTFTTRTVLAGRRLVLVGGGDPYLASRPTVPGQPAPYPPRADVASLADLTAEGLRERGVRSVSVGYDDGLFTGPAASPSWEPSYLPDQVVAPITSLWVDGGRPRSGFGRVEDPAQYAARVFADALRREGIGVRGALAERPAPDGAEEVAAVTGAPLDQVVEHVLDVSDNEAAEVLAHQVGLAVVGEGSFEGGRRGCRRDARRAGRRCHRRPGVRRLGAVAAFAGAARHAGRGAPGGGVARAPRAARGRQRAARRRLHRLAGAALRRGGRAGRGRRTRQDRHAHRRLRPRGPGHRRRGRPRWCSRPWPTRSRCSTPSTRATPSTASPPPSPPAAARR